MAKKVFKTHQFGQIMLLPPSLEEMINKNHPVRIVSQIIDQKENIHYMWVSGMSTPDHNTINRFRGERLQEVLKQVFSQVVMLLVDHGLVNMIRRTLMPVLCA